MVQDYNDAQLQCTFRQYYSCSTANNPFNIRWSDGMCANNLDMILCRRTVYDHRDNALKHSPDTVTWIFMPHKCICMSIACIHCMYSTVQYAYVHGTWQLMCTFPNGPYRWTLNLCPLSSISHTVGSFKWSVILLLEIRMTSTRSTFFCIPTHD